MPGFFVVTVKDKLDILCRPSFKFKYFTIATFQEPGKPRDSSAAGHAKSGPVIL
jgi:hypothetical protein